MTFVIWKKIAFATLILSSVSNCLAGPTNQTIQDDSITPKSIDPTFFVFSTKTDVEVLKYYSDVSQLKFNTSKAIRFVIHGWTDYFESGNWMDLMKDTLLEVSNYDSYIVLTDWSRGSKDLYWRSVRATRSVAKAVAMLLDNLDAQFDLDMRKVQCIGHSLGGQTCGFVGKEMKKRGRKIGVVSSMDPAGPNFRMEDERQRVSKGDAYFVEIFHTNMARTALGGLGSVFPAGHVDYYFNGGQYQPGCFGQINITYDLNMKQFTDATIKEESDQLLKIVDFLDCSHSRILDFYTVNFRKEGDCEPVAYQCGSWDEFLAGRCADCGSNNKKCRLVGFYPEQLPHHEIPAAEQGYYLFTEGQVPFCSYLYQIKVEISNSSSVSNGKLVLQFKSTESEEIKIAEIVGDFKPSTQVTALIHNDRRLGSLMEVSILYLSNSKHESTISLQSIEVNYMSSTHHRVRTSLSTSTCDYSELAVGPKALTVELC